MAYLLDSDVFIRASNLHYGFDTCPGFWQWLESANQREQVCSISQVYAELQPGDETLANWAKSMGTDFFREIDMMTLKKLETIKNWTRNQQYSPAAMDTFLQAADSALIAHALAHDHIVVTHEVPAESRKKIKIPNVCVGVGVKCIGPFEMLKRERVKFVLSQ